MTLADWITIGFVVVALVLLAGPLRWWARWCERRTAAHDPFPHVKLTDDDPPRDGGRWDRRTR